MNNRQNSLSLLALLSLSILLAACSAPSSNTAEPASQQAADADNQAAPTTAAELAAEEPAAEDESAAEPEAVPSTADFELDGRTEYIDFPFTIAHPAGWFVATDAPVTIISETEEDHDLAFVDENNQDAGYSISLDHRDMDFLRGIGLPEEAELIDLYAMNQNFFNWPDGVQPEEAEAFGSPALVVETQDGENWQVTYMGFANDEAFLLVLTAPSEEQLQAFLPTWELILASIEPAAQ